jgi:cysteinyl-tRNA synthetase
VRNITDIDDKIIRARWKTANHPALTDEHDRRHAPRTSTRWASNADHEPRATDYVPQMLA